MHEHGRPPGSRDRHDRHGGRVRPVTSILLIAASFAVFIVYELPNLNSAVYHASFYPCTAGNACRGQGRGG